ncbi:hypothetical protein CYFUS_004953 [Cystobacter fuscus]|uniref:Immunity MXAN-0049 protein domain-containing protein n=1 Tax=Cystobacter fuscus TaxID=43 RepID=A0A250J6F4_9BACT|nr:DUF1629 domain-containing protein [Cystobacter fuscus]ATB39509.1 hypothetical protein CYFUS_004953 [Cystobacter fuscus]
MNFFHIETMGDPNDESLCFLHDVVEGTARDSARYSLGKPLLSVYPKEPKLFMSPESRGMKLADLLGNTEGMLVVSKALRETIEKHCQGVEIEYLPFTLYDHRKRVHSQDYCIVNPIGSLDCLDEAASGVQYGSEGSVIDIGEIVLDRNKVKDAPQLFRVKQRPSQYILGVKLAREIYDRDFTNVLWTELRFSDSPRDVT